MAALKVSTLTHLLVTLLLVAKFGQSDVVQQADEDKAVNLVFDLIGNLSAPPPPGQGPGPGPGTPPGRPRINNPSAKIIRLIFHDCVVTGCDGCLEITNPENFGLEGISRELNQLYDNELNDSRMSRADFYALAAVVAVREASERQTCMRLQQPPNCTKPVPEMRIVYGRKDCATSPNSDRDFGFPDAHGDLEHVMEVFRDGMRMTERQVVALIGAHTMGMTSPQNSGFQGPWAPPTDVFGNAFFRTLMANSSAWRQNELNLREAPDGLNPRYQWDLGSTTRSIPEGRLPPGDNTRMMLNTDMALFKRMTPDDSGRETDEDCRENFLNCERSRTANIVMEYARNNTRWLEDFGPTFQILLEHGYPDNHLVAAEVDLPPLVDPTRAPVSMVTDSAQSIFAALIVIAAGSVISALFQ